MTGHSPRDLRERLAGLGSDQLLKLVTGLQERIDILRSQEAWQPAEIAVIGVGCRFPGAYDTAAFRRLLNEGRDAVSAAPDDRPERDALPIGGYVDAIDRFDAGFFGIRESEAVHMEPQHRLVREVAWHALEDAAARDAQRRQTAPGVVRGTSTHDSDARSHGSGSGGSEERRVGKRS